MARRRTAEGVAFLLAGGFFIQWSSAVIQAAFTVLGPSAASAWRVTVGAIVLLCVVRPRVRSWTRDQWMAAAALGLSTMLMNQCFYQCIARIPLGGAVAIEYLGPFMVAALGRRTWRHGVFVLLAGAGVIAITRPGSGLNVLGVLFGLGSGLFWALYMFASARVGRATRGFEGLAVSMSIAAVVSLPLSLGRLPQVMHHPSVLGRVTVVAVMAIVLGFGAEMQAMRRLRPAVAGVLMATEPAIALLVGWMLLAQVPTFWDVVGIVAVVIAGAGVTWDSDPGDLEVPQ